MADPEYGDTWVYESLVGALPGVHLSDWLAIALQFVLFESGVVLLGVVYGLEQGALAGTVAVGVATVGSLAMLRIGRLVRATDTPAGYRHLLFGSSIEVVLAVVAFVGLVTYLFAVDPGRAGDGLVTELLGPQPPAPALFVTLLVLWDLCYRIGTGWWASVCALWRSLQCDLAPDTARELRRVDLGTMGFGGLQLALVPFVLDAPVLLVAVVGHVVAVVAVTGTSVVLLWRQSARDSDVTT